MRSILRILIIDDEQQICRNCMRILTKSGYEVDYALNGYDALKMMEDNRYQIVITDLKMSRLGGMEVLLQVKESYPDVQVIVITGYASVASAVEVMKMGACDYLPKPFTPHELRAVVKQTADQREIFLQNHRLGQPEKFSKPISHQLIGSSPKIEKVISMVGKVAPTNATVLVYGESGTGKELIARAVHANSQRHQRVFYAVDCGTLNSSLLASELFGHKQGAFTGAHKDKDGIFKLAHGGTVFLDEISNISLEVQGKLLRFLETREFLMLGDTKLQQVDVRLILATNKDLAEMVAQHTFREDFYYRIDVYPIILPPLRERKTDILPIAYHFLEQFSHQLEKSIEGFDDDAVHRLKAFDWPGNVRQLKNVVERAVILCETNRILLKDIPLFMDREEMEELLESTPTTNEELKRLKKTVRQKAIQRIEKNFVLNALAESKWNVTQAAKKTGLQRTNLHNLMKKYHIVRPYDQQNKK